MELVPVPETEAAVEADGDELGHADADTEEDGEPLPLAGVDALTLIEPATEALPLDERDGDDDAETEADDNTDTLRLPLLLPVPVELTDVLVVGLMLELVLTETAFD